MNTGLDAWEKNSGIYGQVYPQFADSAECSTQASSACAPVQVYKLVACQPEGVLL